MTILSKYYYENGFDFERATQTEYNAFAREFKKIAKDIAESLGGNLISFSKGYFEVSCFLKIGNQYIYVATRDLRFFDWNNKILYRTAKSEKDYTGGFNHFCSVSNLKIAIEKMVKTAVM